MGHCLCKCKTTTADDRESSGRTRSGNIDQGADDYRPASFHSQQHSNRIDRASVGVDVRDLILETLTVIRTLVNNEQEPPTSMLKLNLIADKEQGWLLIVKTMIEIVPSDNPLGPAVITLFLDESPLPTRETVVKLLFHLNLSAALSDNGQHPPTWHRNTCIVLGCIAEKLAGANSVATFRQETLHYLTANLKSNRNPNVILFSLIALEKYAQTSENRSTICAYFNQQQPHPLKMLETWLTSTDFVRRQVGFCAQWALDNLFVKEGRSYSYEVIDTKGINAMLNHEDVSEYLKIGPNGLEARCDVSSFESVRCTFQVTEGIWFYEALIITPGVMQIGWATKDSKFFNHEGYGIGDDEYSVAYDGCRQLVWHNASSEQHSHASWKPGDMLGCLLDMDSRQIQFYLNGSALPKAHTKLFESLGRRRDVGFFAAASFMSFQQCRFNFGADPFRFPPEGIAFCCFNNFAELSDEQRVILPRRRKLELLRQFSVPEDSCHLCYSNTATVTLSPCSHSGFCSICAAQLDQCPMCRTKIAERLENFDGAQVATTSSSSVD